ncbi:hypothetical protein C8J57DRAFT_1534540 [Mycena rebaudengoi]|nr:hypothetical protein C8J57DRAFT_1534540 [Mycena rebaudengoi]
MAKPSAKRSKELKHSAILGVRTPQIQGWRAATSAPDSYARERMRQRVLMAEARWQRVEARKKHVEALEKARFAPSRSINYFGTPMWHIQHKKKVAEAAEKEAVEKVQAEECAVRKAKVEQLERLRNSQATKRFGIYYLPRKLPI